MNKLLKHYIIFAFLIGFVGGCAYNPRGTSVGDYSRGPDSTVINDDRDQNDPRMTREQAEQYSIQRRQIVEEMALEERKRQRNRQETQDALNTERSIRREIEGIIRTIQSLDNYNRYHY